MLPRHYWMTAIAASCSAGLVLSPAWADGPPPLDLSNAEVIVTSSSNTSYVGMANTDAQGRFVINGVPAGGINVVIRRDGKVIAQGAGVTPGGNLSEAQQLDITLAPIPTTLKSKPAE